MDLSKEARRIPRDLLEVYAVLPSGRVDRTGVMYVMCPWSPQDTARVESAVRFLQTYFPPGVSYRFVQGLTRSGEPDEEGFARNLALRYAPSAGRPSVACASCKALGSPRRADVVHEKMGLCFGCIHGLTQRGGSRRCAFCAGAATWFTQSRSLGLCARCRDFALHIERSRDER